MIIESRDWIVVCKDCERYRALLKRVIAMMDMWEDGLDEADGTEYEAAVAAWDKIRDELSRI